MSTMSISKPNPSRKFSVPSPKYSGNTRIGTDRGGYSIS